MMPEIFGAGLIGSALQAGTNYLFGAQSNQWAQEREEIAREQNYLLGEKSAQNADARTRALYNDLYSPQAQMRQLKEAGLSPSLFYGDAGGISGQTGAQGTGAAGINPSTFGIQPLDAAMISKTLAETDKIKAETKNVEKTTEKTSAEIDNIIADTNNKLLESVYNEYKNALAECELTTEASLVEPKIKNYITQTKYLEHLTDSAEAKAQIDVETKNAVINYIEEKTKNLAADTLLKKANTLLAHANVKVSKVQVDDLISQICTRRRTIDLKVQELELLIHQWSIQNGLQREMNEATIQKMSHEILQGYVGELLELTDGRRN